MDYLTYTAKTVASGALSTIGAFVPVFVLMYIHYRIRHAEYAKKRVRLKILAKGNDSLLELYDAALQSIYRSWQVDNYKSLVEKLLGNKAISPQKYLEIISLIQENIDNKLATQEKITKLVLDDLYMEQYSFWTYISNILDQNYPINGTGSITKSRTV